MAPMSKSGSVSLCAFVAAALFPFLGLAAPVDSVGPCMSECCCDTSATARAEHDPRLIGFWTPLYRHNMLLYTRREQARGVLHNWLEFGPQRFRRMEGGCSTEYPYPCEFTETCGFWYSEKGSVHTKGKAFYMKVPQVFASLDSLQHARWRADSRPCTEGPRDVEFAYELVARDTLRTAMDEFNTTSWIYWVRTPRQ